MIIVTPFPDPPPLVADLYAQRALAEYGTEEEKKTVPPLSTLPRPWVPASCPGRLRLALWLWLDEVAGWLNHDYAQQSARIIPPCWPQHPHLAHELAVLACLRREAERDTTPAALEEWHRYSLPMFIERMSGQLGGGCTSEHTSWPARPRWRDYVSDQVRAARRQRFADDVAAEQKPPGEQKPPAGVDPATGEITGEVHGEVHGEITGAPEDWLFEDRAG